MGVPRFFASYQQVIDGELARLVPDAGTPVQRSMAYGCSMEPTSCCPSTSGRVSTVES